MISHKYPDVTSAQLIDVHPRLHQILEVMSFLAFTWYGDDIVITAIYDPHHPGSTHRLKERKFRFVDLSVLKSGGQIGSERLRNTINVAYSYDGKPGLLTIPALNHTNQKSPSTADHFHVQIGPKWAGIPTAS
jgi:hypothetical protein